MPHSSGGGSHGGGSHGGGRSGGSSAPRVSRKPYVGARRFIYYYPGTNRHIDYYYQGTPGHVSIKQFLVPMVFVVLMFCLVASAVCSEAFFVPRKTDLSSYDASIYVEDASGVMEDRAALCRTLEDFQSLTGVSPSVELVLHSAWEPYYSDLETFAYSEYLRLFDDEMHWLIVISLPEDYAAAQFVDWQWEGMIGDDVGQTINSASEDTFTQLLQTQLLRMEGAQADRALIAAFEAYAQVVMTPRRDYASLLPILPVTAFLALFAVAIVQDYRNRKRLEQAIPVQDNARELNCEYCGCMYVAGSVSVCPHCGAPIPASGPAGAEA